MELFDFSPLASAFGGIATGLTVAVLLGLIIGVVSAAFGVGGGFLITPFCHSVLHMPASLAVATSMGQIPFMGMSATWQYARAGVINYRLAAALLITAVPSAQYVAHWLASRPANSWQAVWGDQTLPDLLVLAVFTLLMGSFGIYNLIRSFQRSKTAETVHAARTPLLPTLLIGAVFGALSALLGIGGGFFAVPWLVYACGLRPIAAVATSLFAVLVTSAVTTVHYLFLGNIYFGISLALACGSVLGAQLGSRLALKTPQHTLLRAFGGLQIATCVIYLASRL